MQRGGADVADPEAELQRLRRQLYRPSPPEGALERYLELQERLERSVPAAAASTRPDAPGPPPPQSRRVRLLALVAAGGAAVAVAAVLAASPLVRPAAPDPTRAEPLIAAGPYAVADRDALAALLLPAGTDSATVLRAVEDSELAQLDVWDAREPGLWVQQGTGGFSRRFAGVREPAPTARPFSVIMECAVAGRYRWTVRGTTPARPAVHVLETAGSTACGPTPTVATFTRPAGATVRGFDLAIGRNVRWAMGFVYPVDAG